MYSQTDAKWGNQRVGNSTLPFRDYGCLVTIHAQALNLAGHLVDPGTANQALRNAGAFNGPLLIWSRVNQAYPAYAFGGAGYEFIEVWFGKIKHWVLKHRGVYYEPYYGRKFDTLPPYCNKVTGRKMTAAIAPATVAPIPTPPNTFPVTAIRTCNVRSQPRLSAPLAGSRTLNPGDTFTGVAVVVGEMVGGSDKWIKSSKNNYVWANNTRY